MDLGGCGSGAGIWVLRCDAHGSPAAPNLSGKDLIAMVEEEREATAAPRPVPKQSSGPAPGGDEEFGDAPKPDENFGDAPAPAPGTNRNVSLLVGGLIAVVVLIAVALGFLVR
jgi:hypothetical protein